MWTLFLDDERFPDEVQETISTFDGIVIARSVKEAIDFLSAGLPQKVSLDHDLGEGQPVAVDFVWRLIEGHLDGKWDCSSISHFYVHSANNVGARNMLALWENFTREMNIQCQIKKVYALKKPTF